jgi:aldose 1-epimerase
MTADAPELALAAGDARVVLVPATGGAIAEFTFRGCPVLRRTSPGARAADDVRLHACYPLVPYSNRIAQATVRVGARDCALTPNFGDSPHSIHGVGWQRAWSVAAASGTEAEIVLHHDPAAGGSGAWPFAFRARQSFFLSGTAGQAELVATLTIENTCDSAFPCGLGFHPFFPRSAGTTLGFRAGGVFDNDPSLLPVAHVPIDEARRFDPPRRLAETALDHVFSGWAGRAALAQPDAGIVVELSAPPPATFLVVYVPQGGDFLAVEPVTHMTDAFNRAARGESGTGTRVLEPGATLSCTMHIAVRALA